MPGRIAALCLMAAAGLAACDNAGEMLGPPPPALGGVIVSVYVDRDGSGTPSPADTAFSGARVALFAAGGTDTFRVATTDTLGLATFDSVPLGRYHFGVDRRSIGDSLPVLVGEDAELRLVARRDSAIGVGSVRLGYREVTVREARSLPAGMRVMVRGVVTAPFQNYSDSSTFLAGDADAIRVTGARHRPGRILNNIGDSVLVLGTTGSVAGQPVMVDGLIASVGIGTVPEAVEIGVGELPTARGGELDARLVRVMRAVIADTVSSGAFFTVIVADSTEPDTARIAIDTLMRPNRGLYVPGRGIIARGVLFPVSPGVWMLRPRPVSGEISIH